MTTAELVSKYQCPGCVLGLDPETCSAYAPDESYGASCTKHTVGTWLPFAIGVALGLPRGFNRPTINLSEGLPAKTTHSTMEIRLWESGTAPEWDRFNIAVWAMEKDGALFVRTVSPRTARLFVDVIEGGTLALVPGAVNVGEFYEEID